MNKKIILIFFVFLIINIVSAKNDVKFDFEGTDVDQDEMVGYLIVFEGDRADIYDMNKTSDVIENGVRKANFSYIKSFGDGHYRFELKLLEVPHTIDDIKYGGVIVSNGSYYFPPLRIDQKYIYTISGNLVELENIVTFLNQGEREFKNVPLYDYCAKCRGCGTVNYYKLNRELVEEKSTPYGRKEIRRVNIKPNEKRGFIATCKFDNIIEDKNDYKHFYYKVDIENNLKKEIIFGYYNFILKIPKKSGIKNFKLIYSDLEPYDEDGTYKYFSLKENFEDTDYIKSEIRFDYKYVWPPIYGIIIFIVLTVITIILNKIFDNPINKLLNIIKFKIKNLLKKK